jgi:hypothetical protein
MWGSLRTFQVSLFLARGEHMHTHQALEVHVNWRYSSLLCPLQSCPLYLLQPARVLCRAALCHACKRVMLCCAVPLQYCECTDGSHVEVKASALVWHYGDADPDFGNWQVRGRGQFMVGARGVGVGGGG